MEGKMIPPPRSEAFPGKISPLNQAKRRAPALKKTRLLSFQPAGAYCLGTQSLASFSAFFISTRIRRLSLSSVETGIPFLRNHSSRAWSSGFSRFLAALSALRLAACFR